MAPSRAASPIVRPFRFSSQQDYDSPASRRYSKLPELLTRKRTASLPPGKDKDGLPGECALRSRLSATPSERALPRPS